MASNTALTRYRRKIRKRNSGKERKRALRMNGSTPSFAIHTPEADSNAPNQTTKTDSSS